MATKLFLQERLEQILETIEEHERVSVPDLSKRFGVSHVTIRSDLANLEKQGFLVRTHGGAIARPELAMIPAFRSRLKVQVKEKERIAQAAAKLVNNGDSIALDDSTTSWYIAQHLKDHQELTVVTNGLYVALEFLDSPRVSVVMPGGSLRTVSASLVGEDGLGPLERYYIHKGFFSARGLTMEEGLTDPDLQGAELKKRMVNRSKQIIAIVDSTKFNQVSFATFASPNQIDHLFTDVAAPEEILKAMRQQGVKITLV